MTTQTMQVDGVSAVEIVPSSRPERGTLQDTPTQRSSLAATLARAAKARRGLLSLTAAFALVVVVIKVRLLPFDVSSLGELARWVLRLAVVCGQDVLFVAGLWLSCALLGRAVLRWPRLHGAWRIVQFAVFYLMAAYAVFALVLFRVTMQPFSIRMLTFVDGPATMQDSVAVYCTWYWVGSMIFVPLAVLLAPWMVGRLAALSRRADVAAGAPAAGSSRLRLAVTLGALGLIAAYFVCSQAYVQARWNEPRRWERRIACNPHLAFLTSCVEELLKEESWTAIYHGEANEQDFISRRRPDDAQRTLNLPKLAPSPRPKNVVVFFLESIGAEYLSLYGSKHDTTPHVKKLVADHGVVFDNFYVTVPYSCKSIVSLSASVYERLDWKLIVTDSPEFRVPIITEVLDEQGYRTCYAHSGYWSWRSRDKFLKDRVGTLLDAEQMPDRKISSWGVADKAMFQATLDWIDADPSKPFFLLSYTIETHHPYATPAVPLKFDVQDKELNDYLNAIRATDENIAWFMQELDKRGQLDDTLIVITADHGEAFGQHNQREHNFGVYECNVHIPLVMIHPSLKSLPRHVRSAREQIDVAPTVLDLLGVKSPAVWQGRNLFRPDDGRPTYFFCIGNFVVLGLRDGAYKYHFYVDSGLEELFDIEVDPGEENNLAADHPQRCRDYRKRVGGLARYQRKFLAEQGSP
jgi:arylsulfatase A-like enzyme